MGAKTGIEWTDATWNVVTGCSPASDGCRNCYAALLAATRLKKHPSRKGLARKNAAGVAVFNGEVRFNEKWLTQPLAWKRPRWIFVVAHGDLFFDNVPDEWIDRVFAVMALAPQHTFQVLTKRPERMRNYVRGMWRPHKIARAAIDLFIGGKVKPDESWPVASIGDIDDPDDVTLKAWPLPNVWLGTSVEDQATADERIPLLLDTPAAKRFISAEPLLGPVDLSRIDIPRTYGSFLFDALAGVGRTHHGEAFTTSRDGNRLDWVIAGGESGPGARPMHPDWARSLRDQCAADGVPFFFKQWGAWREYDDWPRDEDGNHATVEVGSDEAMALFNRRTDCLIAVDGTVYRDPESIPVDVPCRLMKRLGKKASGPLLDGREHREFPA
nr:phage Gp37/Gp68 family protein [Aerococcus urinae]